MTLAGERRNLQSQVAPILALCGLGWGVLALVARVAQAQPQVQVEAKADDAPEAEPTEGVFVRDSPAAWDTFQNGLRMERLKEWSKAADFYQEVVEKYRDRVVPGEPDADHHTTHYTSIVRRVQEQLSKWPSEGLDVYRARYETAARSMLDAAKPGDAFALHQVFDRYFMTNAGKAAGNRLIDLSLERGEYRTAASIGQHLLQLHPGLDADAGAIQYRTALAFHFAGDEGAADSWAKRLASEHGTDRGVVRGLEVNLAESLRQELKVPAETAGNNANASAADSWPMAFGDPSRSRISSGAGKPGVRLYSVRLAKPQFTGVQPQQRAPLEQSYNSSLESGQALGIMPVVDRGQLFFQDGQRIYAVSLDSGLPLPGWFQTYAGSGQFVLPNTWGSARAHQLTLTLTPGEVLGVMGQQDRQGLMMGMAVQGETRLVCLDRDTGHEKWITQLSQLPQEAASLRELQMTGSPLVVGDNVMVMARAGKQVQFEDSYVLSFDLRTGKYRWSCYVASANLGGFGGMPAAFDENTSHLSYADGLVFVQTNLGAIAAVDPYGATLVWVDIYPSRNGPMPGGPFMPPNMFNPTGQMTGPLPWTNNPVIVSNGRIFTLPREGKKLLVYDATSGKKLKSIAVGDLRECDTLLGVIGDQVIMSGSRDVVAFNWTRYDPDKFTEDDLDWIETLPNPIRGRGFIAGHLLFVPAKDRLWWLDLAGHRIAGAYPLHPRTWEDGEGPGNVLVTSDHVVIAGATSLDTYTDLTVARAKLDQEVAASPNDPQPRLRYAELLYVARNPDAALAKLDEAIALLGGLGQMQPGLARDEVFSDALSFAQKLTDREPDPSKATAFFERAASAALNPVQQVRVRLSRAHSAEKGKDAAGAVRLYQEILSDAKLRTVAISDDVNAIPAPASTLAEKGIDSLIRSDPTAYAPVEQQALAALADARHGEGDPAQKLLEVADAYPNSSVASQAALEAADAYEKADNPRLAVQVVRQLYFRNPDGPLRARVLETMARNYLAIPDRSDVVAAAAARLAQGALLPGDPYLEKPLRLPNQQVLSHVRFSEALEQVRKYGGETAVKNLPDFHLPMPRKVVLEDGRHAYPKPFAPRSDRTQIDGVEALLVPERKASRNDRVVVWTSAQKLQVLGVGKADALGSFDLPDGAVPRRCGWIGGNLLVWGGSSIWLLKENGGQPLWTIDLRAMGPLDVARGPAAAAPAALLRRNPMMIAGGQRIFIRNGGRMIIRGVGGMQVLPPANPAAPPAPRQAGGPEEAVDAIPVGDRILITTSTGRVFCAQLTDGRILWQTRLSDRPIDRLEADDDFTVLKVTDETSVRLIALDTFSGEPRGSKTFSNEGATPVNFALSADGTLVYTLPDRLCLKNLYTPWPDSSDREITSPSDVPSFRGNDGAATDPDQLVISEGRILALADTGTQKIVRVFSLETGNPVPLRYNSARGEEMVDRVLSAGLSWNTKMRVVGSHLYLFGLQGAASYNLDRPAESWNSSGDDDAPMDVKEEFVGQQFLVLVQQDAATPPDDGQANPPAVSEPNHFTLKVFGIYPVSDKDPSETGRLDFSVPLNEPSGIVGRWQAVDGGFYYLSGDKKLHMLLGSRE